MKDLELLNLVLFEAGEVKLRKKITDIIKSNNTQLTLLSMAKEHLTSGTPTPYKDKDGIVIRVHDYVKDGNGNSYYVNSHLQAVPREGDAPVVELSRLVEESQVSRLTVEELLNIKELEADRRRGGRRKKPEPSAEAAQQEKKPEEAAAPADDGRKGTVPACEKMLMALIPDDVLAAELRRRGYTLCAVRPALIEL